METAIDNCPGCPAHMVGLPLNTASGLMIVTVTGFELRLVPELVQVTTHLKSVLCVTVDGVYAGEVRLPDILVQFPCPAGEDCHTYWMPVPGGVALIRLKLGVPLQLYDIVDAVASPPATVPQNVGVNL